MITKSQRELAEEMADELQETPRLNSGLGGDASPAPEFSQFPVPASPAGAGIILPVTQDLHLRAAVQLNSAVQCLERQDRRSARAHIDMAVELLNEAEIED